jgi:hypothetical protein
LYRRACGHNPRVTDQEYEPTSRSDGEEGEREERGDEENDLLAAQEHKGYGEDEGEREQELEDE